MPRTVTVTVKVNPRARKVVRQRSAILVKRLLRAIVNELRTVLSRPYPPASRPGEAPHLRTGTLRDSVSTSFDEARGEGRVDVAAPYAGYLEAGTKRMASRPFALKTVRRVFGWFRSGSFSAVRDMP